MLVARGVLHVVHLISFSLFALLLKYPYPSRSMHPVRQTGIHQDLEDPSEGPPPAVASGRSAVRDTSGRE